MAELRAEERVDWDETGTGRVWRIELDRGLAAAAVDVPFCADERSSRAKLGLN